MQFGQEQLDVYRFRLERFGQRNDEVREHPGRYDDLDYDNDNDAKGIPSWTCLTY